MILNFGKETWYRNRTKDYEDKIPSKRIEDGDTPWNDWKKISYDDYLRLYQVFTKDY